MIAYLADHPEAIVSVLVAALVHLRAAMPAATPGTTYALVLKVWDAIAGNYGKAKNASPEVKS